MNQNNGKSTPSGVLFAMLIEWGWSKRMKEYYYDKLLQVKTGANRQEYNNSLHQHPYEPTDYHVLEILLDQYEFKDGDCMVDFGSGKGRLCFFIHYFHGVLAKGIEMDNMLYQEAIDNKKSYIKKDKKGVQFFHSLAETYAIDPQDNRFYFFNPFSVQIFMKVIHNILLSVEASNRNIELILYYASADYTYYLEKNTDFRLRKEIKVPGLNEEDEYERLLIYYLPYL